MISGIKKSQACALRDPNMIEIRICIAIKMSIRENKK